MPKEKPPLASPRPALQERPYGLFDKGLINCFFDSARACMGRRQTVFLLSSARIAAAI